MEKITVEYLLRQESFLQYCLHNDTEAVDYWKSWLEQNPEHSAVVAEAASLAKDSSLYLEAERLKPAAMEHMRAYLEKADLRVTAPVRKMNWGKMAVAAAVLALVSLLVWYLVPGGKKMQDDIKPVAGNLLKAGEQRYNIPARKMINLADGSFVLLDSGASLRIDDAFGSRERNVFLTGTAWFRVAKNQDHPFRVITGNIRTTALGTAFRVEAANTSKTVKVELEEGKVMVERIGGKAPVLISTLLPSESITVHQQDAGTEKKKFALAGLQAWKAEEIVFNDAPLSDVISQLQIVYDQPILLEDAQLMNETFTGRFRNDSLPAVMEVLCFTLNRKFRITTDNKILIY